LLEDFIISLSLVGVFILASANCWERSEITLGDANCEPAVCLTSLTNGLPPLALRLRALELMVVLL